MAIVFANNQYEYRASAGSAPALAFNGALNRLELVQPSSALPRVDLDLATGKYILVTGTPPSFNWALMPSVPASRRSAIEAALTNAALGQPYTAQDIFAVLATASHWWSLEAAGVFSDTAATTPAASGGAIAAAKDWINGVLLTQSNSASRPTLSANGATFSSAANSNLNGAFALTNNVTFTAFVVARPISNKAGAFLKTGASVSGSAGWATGMGSGTFNTAGYGFLAVLDWVSYLPTSINLPSQTQSISGFQRSGGLNRLYINGSQVVTNGSSMQPVAAFTAIGGYSISSYVNAEISSAIAFQSALTPLQVHQINRFLIAYYNPAADIDATIYGAAANATSAEYSAIGTLAKALKSNGTWDKYQAIYPLFGDSSGWRNSRLNLRRTFQNSSAYLIDWVASVAYAPNGVTGSGSSYGNTNYRGVIKHASIWVHGSSADTTHSYGRIKAAIPAEWSTVQARDGSNLVQAWGQDPTAISGAVPTGADPGLISVTADLGQLMKLYRNGTTISTASSPLTVTPSNPTNLDCFLLAANLDGSAYAHSARRTSFFALSDQHFTDSEIAADYAAIAAFQAAMGR